MDHEQPQNRDSFSFASANVETVFSELRQLIRNVDERNLKDILPELFMPEIRADYVA